MLCPHPYELQREMFKHYISNRKPKKYIAFKTSAQMQIKLSKAGKNKRITKPQHKDQNIANDSPQEDYPPIKAPGNKASLSLYY